MSVEAVGWAFRQQLPPKPKILLLTLADQTDEHTGKVCYGKTDAEHLARKASISRPTFFRYIGALIRNGYIIRKSGKANGHHNEWWLCLDRIPTDIEDWQWDKDGEEADDAQDVEGVDQNETPPPEKEGGSPADPPGGSHADPPKESLDNQRTSRAREKSRNSFSRSAQAVAVAAATPKPAESVFVIEGTRAWTAWDDHMRRARGRGLSFSYRGTDEHRGKTGRHFPTLWPPKLASTGPPSSSDPLSDEASAEIKAKE